MANDDPILPGLDLIGTGKDALIAARPSTSDHVEQGTYGDAFKGWRGQFGLAREGLAAEVTAARLSKSTGAELRELAASNYDTPALPDPTKATGELFIERTVVHVRPDTGTITAADASDLTTVEALLAAIAAAMNAHIAAPNNYNSATGLGSHQADDASGTFSVGSTATMAAIVATTISFVDKINRHLANESVAAGAALSPAPHISVDTLNTFTLATIPFSSGAGAFGVNSKASQQSVLVALNTAKRAVNAHFALEAAGGVVPKGLKISLGAADPVGARLIPSAEYLVAADTYIAPGTRRPSLPIIATVAGPQANVPQFSWLTQQITIQGALYDDGATLPFSASLIRAAGGSSGQSDKLLAAAAAASWLGIYGPTTTAMLAGSLRSTGVAHFVELDDTTDGTAYLYVTDESWAQSLGWQYAVEQALRDGWLGVGQRIALSSAFVLTQVVRARLTVKLRDKSFLTDPTAITAALQAAIKSYFDDRQDWYVWKTASLRGVCTAADKRRILQVSSLVVLDHNGEPVTEPTAPDPGDVIYHWLFADNGLEVTYVAPS